MKKLSDTYKWPLLHLAFFITLIGTLLIFCFATSPLLPSGGFDSNLFQIIGRGWLSGHVPYRDIFDHKGPFLWVIEALGLLLTDDSLGIFLLEIVVWSLTAFFIYRTARLFSSKTAATIAVFTMIPLIILFVQEGNRCEEYSLPFVSLGYWAFGISMAKAQIKLTALVLGLCFAAVFLIRINDGVSQFAAFFIFYAISDISQKHFNTFVQRLLFALLGIGIITIPLVLYYHSQGALDDMIYGTYTHNAIYAKGDGGFIHGMLSGSRIVLLVFPAGIAAFIRLWYMRNNNKVSPLHKDLLTTVLISLCMSYIFIGPRNYIHYYMIAIPSFSLLMAFISTWNGKRYVAALILLFFTVCSLTRPDHIINNMHPITKWKKGIDSLHDAEKQLFLHIDKSKKDSIWYYNDNYVITDFFVVNKITPLNRVLAPKGEKQNPTYFNKKEDKLTKCRPPYILMTSDKEQYQTPYVKQNYHKFAKFPKPLINPGDHSQVQMVIYRRNDLRTK